MREVTRIEGKRTKENDENDGNCLCVEKHEIPRRNVKYRVPQCHTSRFEPQHSKLRGNLSRRRTNETITK